MVARPWCNVLLAAIVAVGCHQAHPETASQGISVVEEEQIAALHASTAYDVVARTHSEFLHSRGRESIDPKVPPIPVHVYVDDTYYSDDINVLRTIPASQLAEVHFYQSYEAQYKFGSGHMGGVVQLVTKH